VDPPPRAAAVSEVVAGVARKGDRLILMLDRDRLCEGSVDLSLPLSAGETIAAGR
jgi:hypothetical protein